MIQELRIRVNLFRNTKSHQRFHLASEYNCIRIAINKHWFDAHSVSRKKQLIGFFIMNCNREKAIEFFQNLFAPFNISLKQNLGVGACSWFVICQLCLDFLVIENLSVENQGVTTACINKWLIGFCRSVNNRQARMT